MIVFEDIEDLDAWLAPLDAEGFWDAVAPWGVFQPEDRAHFDIVLAEGVTDAETMLICLKAEVRRALSDRFGLTHRVYDPPHAAYLQSTH